MKFNWLERSIELTDKGTPFAIATVIRTIAPTSAKPMSKAIILPDGTIEGWIGGGCSVNNVISEGINCINSSQSIILKLSTNISDDGNSSNNKEILLNCESGGMIEFHIEPVLPKMRLVLYGNTPITYAIANMAILLNFDCYLCIKSSRKNIQLNEKIKVVESYKSFSEKCVVIIGSQGEDDLGAIKAAILSNPKYASMIVSKKKASSVLNKLEKMNLSKDRISKIKFPAGLDIGAQTPEEIAISILAEIIREKNKLIPIKEIASKKQHQNTEKDSTCCESKNSG